MEFGRGIHAPLKMNYDNMGDPLTFHLVLSLRQNVNLFSIVVYV